MEAFLEMNYVEKWRVRERERILWSMVKMIIFDYFGPFSILFWVPEGTAESDMAQKPWSTDCII